MTHDHDHDEHHAQPEFLNLAGQAFMGDSMPKSRRKPLANPEIFANGDDPVDEDLDVIDGAITEVEYTTQAPADDYVSGVLNMSSQNDPAQLLPHDTERRRALISNVGNVNMVVGKTSNGLHARNGYVLRPTDPPLEIYVSQPVFCLVDPQAAGGSTGSLSFWVERDV